MELLGTAYTAEALARELLKDRAWFARSERGGVTLSGGEASAQGAFTLEVLRRCREAGAHTALDTCGVAAWDLLAGLYAETDLVLYDLKEADPARHKAHTGLDNRIVFRNLERTAALMREATDREENLFELGRLLADLAPPRFERWELCAFNNLCADKYRRLGKEWEYARAPLMTAEAMEGLVEAARRGSGGTVIVSWTGSVRIEAERTLQC
jgi:pyruvate formate lyase activating enzyme